MKNRDPRKQNTTYSRRDFLKAAAAGAAASLAGCARLLPTRRKDERPPNFIIIFADDLGYADLGCFGAEKIRTPHLDRMAEEGMRFTDFYSTAPVCTPSRASLLTGCYPLRVGLVSVLHPWTAHGLNDNEVTLAGLLKTRGYATACIGKWHLGHHPEFLPTRHGFDYYFGLPYSNNMNSVRKDGSGGRPLIRNEDVVERPADQKTLTKRYAEETIAFIKENKDRPFFVYLPHTFPHTPLYASEDFEGKSEAGIYGDTVEEIDWSVGEIFAALKKLRLDDNTLVVFTSDNGPFLGKNTFRGSAGPFRDGKFSVYEGGMREPCVMRWPGRIPANSICSEMAVTFDLYPTFARLGDADVPNDRVIDGKDIWPLMSGEKGARTPHEAFFYYKGKHLRAVRSGKWKLMVEHDEESKESKDRDNPIMVGVAQRLYDLESDPGETTDVAASHPDVIARLMKRVEAIREDLGDLGRKGKNARMPGVADKPTQEKPASKKSPSRVLSWNATSGCFPSRPARSTTPSLWKSS